MNKPATKLAAKGTLVIAAIIPRGASIPMNSVTLADIASTFKSRFPVLQNIMTTIATITRVRVIPEILLNILPTKYPAIPPIASINRIGLSSSCTFVSTSFADKLLRQPFLWVKRLVICVIVVRIDFLYI